MTTVGVDGGLLVSASDQSVGTDRHGHYSALQKDSLEEGMWYQVQERQKR
jgi:hypothetical protein